MVSSRHTPDQEINPPGPNSGHRHPVSVSSATSYYIDAIDNHKNHSNMRGSSNSANTMHIVPVPARRVLPRNNYLAQFKEHALQANTCVPCKEHSDCKDPLAYCISKVPCKTKTCHQVKISQKV